MILNSIISPIILNTRNMAKYCLLIVAALAAVNATSLTEISQLQSESPASKPLPAFQFATNPFMRMQAPMMINAERADGAQAQAQASPLNPLGLNPMVQYWFWWPYYAWMWGAWMWWWSQFLPKAKVQPQ